MGSLIEINDTLKISRERGFPRHLTLSMHVEDPEHCRRFLGVEQEFYNDGERIYHRAPARVFLVEEIDGKWLYWGNAMVTSQTIEGGRTSGRYKIIKIYDPEFQKRMTIEESPNGKSYFDSERKSAII